MIGYTSSLLQLLAFSGIGILLFAVCLVIGLALYNLKLENNIKTYFINVFLGLFTVVCVYSFVQVGIKTISSIAAMVLVFLCYKNTSRFKFDKLDIPSLVPLLYIFPIVFIIYGSFILPSSIENDVRFYAKISHALASLEQENIYHFYNSYSKEFNGVMPYHYFELWIASIFNVLLNIKSIIALKYISYPFLISSISFGILGFVKNKPFLNFLLFLGLSMLPFYLVSVFKSGFTVYTDFWLRPNFIAYYFVLLPLFFLIHEKKWLELYLIACIASTVSVVSIPCITGAIFLLSILLVYKKSISTKQFFMFNSLLALLFICMFVLYAAFAPTINILTSDSLLIVIGKSLSIWKAVVYTIVTLIIECSFLVLISFVINKYVLKDKKLKDIFLFILFQIGIGVVLFQVLNQMDNSYQFPYIAFSAAGFILILILLINIDQLKHRISASVVSILIIVICFYISWSSFNFKSLSASLEEKNLAQNNVSTAWMNEVNTYLAANKQAKGGFVLTKSDLPGFPPKSRNCVTLQMGSFISYLTDNCNLPDLTCKDTLLSDKTSENSNLFLKAEAWIKAFPNYKNQCNALEYIQNNTIDYFICTKNMMNLDSSIVNVISDQQSNYMLVIKK